MLALPPPIIRPLLVPVRIVPLLQVQHVFVWVNPPFSLVQSLIQALQKLGQPQGWQDTEIEHAREEVGAFLADVWHKDAAGGRWKPPEIWKALDALEAEEAVRLVVETARYIDRYWHNPN